ncbi:MAG TPA: hypothetical protein PK295_03995 [Candidatus Magasanikbacteria bacterium]|nr:hypothetical protein [Candidatus Magasanikbacteria bacterium]
MKSAIALAYGEQLKKLFKSSGEYIKPSKDAQRPRPQDPITTSYEFRSPAGQVYIVSFRTLLGDTVIVVDPPVGENPIIAETVGQADILIARVKLDLELEQKAYDPGKFARKTAEKVLA